MTVSIIVITYKRLAELKESLNKLLEENEDFDELILIDNHSEDGTKEYVEELAGRESKLKAYFLEENLGVAGGRNYAIQKATGDILIFLDDDAIFEKKGMISAVKEHLEKDVSKKIGVLAFRIVNYYTNSMRTEEIPFTDKNLDMTVPRLTSAYIGAGHAIRKEVFKECGLYPKDYFYGVEELDLSFRVINHNYEIWYWPKATVLHKQVVAGRVTNQNKWIMAFRNRMLTSYRYLDLQYRIVIGMGLFLKIAIKSRNILVPFWGLKRYIKDKKTVQTERMSDTAMAYLKKNYGRIWL